MKRFIKFLIQPWLLTLLLVLLLALIIWFIGPLIAIADYKPLDSSIVRVISIMVILVHWGLNNLRLTKKQKKQEEEIEKELLDNNQPVEKSHQTPDEAVLTKRFNEAIKTLQTASFGGKGKLYTLPWYIVIGLPGSGKTTALQQSGLQFPLHNTFGDEPIQGTGGTRYCDWWFTNEAIMIDTAGRYTSQEDSQKTDNKAWLGFLQTLRKGRPKRPLNGIVVTISLQDLLTKTNTQKSLHAKAIKQRIQELNHQLNMELPVYVMITKTDTVAGFTTFFSDLEQEDRNQPWGFQFPNKPLDHDKAFSEYFEQEYGHLIETLNQRVLYRLDHEKNSHNRNLIYQFPQQMYALKPAMIEFLKNIFMPNQFETPLMIRGIYFISSTQSNRLSQWVASHFSGSRLNPPNDHVTREPKTFFIYDLLKSVVFKEANLATINIRSRRRFHWTFWSLIVFCSATFAGTTAMWYRSTQLNEAYIVQVQQEINDYVKSTDGGLIETRNWLSLATGLNHLRDLTTGYIKGSNDYPTQQGLGLYQGHKLGAEAAVTYKKALHAFLMQDIGELLEQQIANSRNDEHLYEALKFYLMPHNPEKLDKATFSIWVDILLNQEIPGADNDTLRKHLMSHLNTAIDEKVAPSPINQPLVDKAREQLVLTPLDLRLYRRLKNDYQKNHPGSFSLEGLLGLKGEYVFYRNSGKPLSEGIPNLFTYNGFHAGYNIQNKQLAERLAGEQWIYGDSLPEDLSPEKINEITRKVDDYYFDDYIFFWQDLLSDIRIKSFSSVNQGQAVLRLLASSEKPLVKVIQAVRKNTALSDVPGLTDDKKEAVSQLADTFASNEKDRLQRLAPVSALVGNTDLPGQTVTDAFSNFNQYAQVDEGLPLSQLQNSLEQLNSHFGNLASAGNVKEAAFSATLEAKSGNDPVRTLKQAIGEAHPDVQLWFESIVDNANIVTATAAKGHVNNTWKTDVYSFYEKAIRGRYPVDPSSNQEIKISDFIEFFGPSGILQSYFDSQLKPFVDQSNRQWRWKTNVGIANSRLAIFQQADKIQKLFFGNSGELNVVFLLKPLALDKITTGVLVEMGGQSASYNHGPLRATRMTWPGESTEPSKITFTLASKGTPVSARTEGEWAWFRLLDEYVIDKEQNQAGNLLMTFSLKGITANYELNPQSSFNPFLNNALNNFKLPGRL